MMSRVYVWLGVIGVVLTLVASLWYVHGRLVDVETSNKLLESKLVEVSERIVQQRVAVQEVVAQKVIAQKAASTSRRVLTDARSRSVTEQELNDWFSSAVNGLSCSTGEMSSCAGQ